NAWMPVPGWTGDHEWKGMVPFQDMPRMRNPETGYIVTANNRVVDEEYPHYIGLDYAPEFRARRVTDRLLAIKGKATADDMIAVHGDKTSIPAQTFVRLIAHLRPLDETSTRAQERLASWDGEILKHRVEPTIYNTFRDQLVSLVLEPILGSLAEETLRGLGGGSGHVARLRSRFHTMIEEDDRSLLPPNSDWPSLMAKALSEAVAKLTKDLGANMDNWKWGKVHHTQPQHTLSPSFPHLAEILNPPSLPAGGDNDTPQVGAYARAKPFITRGVSVVRYVFDLDDWNNSAWIVPLGASGHPGSPHYADQATTWGEVQLIPMLYDWTRIIQEAESSQKLKPL
ncbi:MAG: penicillin acylase family protein, partial [Dehalococcoidia bacterium]|nr:penicillin acylase family protein [Dehalococcoidia bacterium]